MASPLFEPELILPSLFRAPARTLEGWEIPVASEVWIRPSRVVSQDQTGDPPVQDFAVSRSKTPLTISATWRTGANFSPIGKNSHWTSLAKHLGCWIAWSPDGTRILASAANPEDLEERVRAAGENFNQCVLEGIPDNDSLIGGG